MKTRKRENGRTTVSPRPRGDSEIAALIENSDRCLLPIVALDGRKVGLITDPEICATAVNKRQLDSIRDAKRVAKRVFYCKPDEDVRAALKTTLNFSQVEVKVVGGILRHHHSW